MYPEYDNQLEAGNLVYEDIERTSDIQLPPVMNVLLFAVWIVICLVGFAVIFLAKRTMAGIAIIAVPTFIGMVIKPTFALCIMMLVLPTGAGIGVEEKFSLDRGVGMAVAVSFLLNLLITRPRLRIRNKALWVLMAYMLWVSLASLGGSYFALELRRAFTVFQLVALVFIVYWIVETNSDKTYLWLLRAYVVGTLGTITLAFITGAAIRAVESETEARYAATLGRAINANMLAGLAVMAFLAAIYLFVRDRNIFGRLVYLIAIIALPAMLLKIGSRGAIIALAFTLFSPLLFVRQVLRRPFLAAMLLLVIILGSLSAGWLVRERELEAPVAQRLTDINRAREAFDYRMTINKQAVKSATVRPLGTSYSGWFERTGLLHFPHSDFFLLLGIYGLPGGLLFLLFVILMFRTVRRIPLGPEKLYTRAILTYLLVIGMNNAFVFKKFYWTFWALVMAGERIGVLYARRKEQASKTYSEETSDSAIAPEHLVSVLGAE